jgi:hypothetical protein
MSDWLPNPRTEQLAMARNWIAKLTAEKRTAWGIPQDEFIELGTLFAAAQEALTRAQDDAQRTPVVNALCNSTFAALA